VDFVNFVSALYLAICGILRMRKITSALNVVVNLLPPSFSATPISY